MNYWSKYFFPLHSIFLTITCLILFYGIGEDTKNMLVLKIPVPNDTYNVAWYNFVSCQLIHINQTHLWNNLALILTLGSIFEFIHGPIPSIVVFWLGGTTGTMLEAGWWNGPYTRLLGASSGAYALTSGYLAHLIMNWKETPFRLMWLLSFLACTIFTILFYFFGEDGRNAIAHVAHLGGFVQGIFVSIVSVRNVRVTREENIARFVSLLISGSIITSTWYRINLLKYMHM